jgi:hypothetical protein
MLLCSNELFVVLASSLADQQDKGSASYQHRNQNTDDERNTRMPTRLDLFRSSAFLRRSDAQPEEKFVHRQKRFREFGTSGWTLGIPRANARSA